MAKKPTDSYKKIILELYPPQVRLDPQIMTQQNSIIQKFQQNGTANKTKTVEITSRCLDKNAGRATTSTPGLKRRYIGHQTGKQQQNVNI